MLLCGTGRLFPPLTSSIAMVFEMMKQKALQFIENLNSCSSLAPSTVIKKSYFVLLL